MIYPAGITAATLASAFSTAQSMIGTLAQVPDGVPAVQSVDPSAALAFQQAWSTILAVLRANNINGDGAPLENSGPDAQVAIGEGLSDLAALPGGPGVDVSPPAAGSSSAGTIAGWIAAIACVVGALVLLGRAQSDGEG